MSTTRNYSKSDNIYILPAERKPPKSATAAIPAIQPPTSSFGQVPLCIPPYIAPLIINRQLFEKKKTVQSFFSNTANTAQIIPMPCRIMKQIQFCTRL